MKNICYVRQTSLSNVAGRIDYITSEKRQEHLYATYSTTTDDFWKDLAVENQRDFLKHGTTGKCIEAREFIIALPPEMYRYDHEELLKHFVDSYKEKYGVECTAALHHNKALINFHIHMIYAERRELAEPEIKTAARNRYYDPEGHHVRTKKEATDEKGDLLPGYTMIQKGEVYEKHRFEKKDPMFKDKAFLEDAKEFFAGLMNPYLSEKTQMFVFPKNSAYLPTKKIGRNNPRAAEIREDNRLRDEWNKKVDLARAYRVPRESLIIVKRRLVTEPIRESRRASQGKHDAVAFRNILAGATKILGTMVSRSKRMPGEEWYKAWVEFLEEFITFCMELVLGRDLHKQSQPYEMMKGKTRHEERSHLR